MREWVARELEVLVTRITRELLREWDACYSDDEIASLVPPEGLTPMEVTYLPIPVEDIMWVLTDVLSDTDCRLFAAWCCAKGRGIRSRESAKIAVKYARGKISSEKLFEARTKSLRGDQSCLMFGDISAARISVRGVGAACLPRLRSILKARYS